MVKGYLLMVRALVDGCGAFKDWTGVPRMDICYREKENGAGAG